MDEPRRRRPPSSSRLDIASGNAGSPAKKRKTRRRRKEVPFWRIVVEVGLVLFLILVIGFGTYRLLYPYRPPSSHEEDTGDDFNEEAGGEQQQQEEILHPTNAPVPRTAPPLKVWQLADQAKYDAYGLEESYSHSLAHFWTLAQTLREEFSDRYGGENAARALLERGMTTFGAQNNTLPSDLQATACRILNSGGDFKIAFGGYSVTAGRGNLFSQSFPFVMQTKLEPLFSALEIELEVRNAAVGGVPSFPYGWCLENFWGLDPDVVSWDYSMNEAGGIPQGLEAYVRQTQSILHKKPKLIIKDTHMATERRTMLKNYFELDSSLVDPVVLHGEPATEPFMAIEETFRPPGFREWRKFGAPPGAPGQAAHHPSKREHELYGWMLTMHFLAALQVMVLHQENQLQLDCPAVTSKTLPPTPITTNDTTSLLFGTSHRIHCRTTLEPIITGELKDIVSSGIVDSGSDLLMPKGAMYYNKGWVLDLSEAEKTAKRQLDRFGGLGFVDSKKAFYGIYNSGPISLHLPIQTAKEGQFATQALQTIVLCQINERQRDPDSCRPDIHLNYWIGGLNVSNATMMDAPGTLYLGHKLCINLTIPADAVVTSYQDQVGVNVTMRVSDMRIMKKELACSLSHVIWEEHDILDE